LKSKKVVISERERFSKNVIAFYVVPLEVSPVSPLILRSHSSAISLHFMQMLVEIEYFTYCIYSNPKPLFVLFNCFSMLKLTMMDYGYSNSFISVYRGRHCPSWIYAHNTANVCISTRFSKTSLLFPTIVVFFTVLVKLRGRGD